MMGVSKNEVEEVLENAKANLRIAGFDEEERRLKQRISHSPQFTLKLPQGPYIFCDFRTLEIPGMELKPPASEALKRMHMLAADPGIVAVMNKHRWHVGIMTEMAPVGYVGVSPECILGFNKNHGEEISLRLRTDDLKGFRKYENIKDTLLHELAHMVFSEHDSNFYALLKQLTQEAATLDWTRSRSHTLSSVNHSEHYEEDFGSDSSNIPQKLGGNRSDQLASARASSVAAAYRRIENDSANNLGGQEVHEEPDPDDSAFTISEEPDVRKVLDGEPDPDDHLGNMNNLEPDPDDSQSSKALKSELCSKFINSRMTSDSDSCESKQTQDLPTWNINMLAGKNLSEEPHPNVTEASSETSITAESCHEKDESHKQVDVLAEPDPDDVVVPSAGLSKMQTEDPDPDDEELLRIQDPVKVVCNRLQKAVEMLKVEVSPLGANSVLQTVFKIIRNAIEHPDETKYRRLRKANPIIQRNVANYKAAMEILFLVGFTEDVVLDELGKAETYLALKRNDPGLLWLAKSSLEAGSGS
ncbi:Ubiquitin and WLM domain-containing metalloprotease [Quillaja saponaria]|uniref:Ubiquitin and WLM domain-containing metalloprotease n=1 Tax=Quillaja saponaria TaxID=32244 RepID=A0AAD7PM69_QUISA|nr:Ubiquitin and WLM domain-containing metalloprotease [Quillaja saponaria]